MPTVSWGCAIDYWEVRRRNLQERTLKTMSICGFRGVELQAASGRMAPLGRPDLIELNFGSTANFVEFVHSCGVDSIPSFFYNPGIAFLEESAPGRSPSNRADHAGILASTTSFAKFLHDVGGSCLVVRPMGSYWREAPVTEEKIKSAAECWNAVGAMSKGYGVQTAVHPDFLCAIHDRADIEKLLQLTNPEFVGLALDPAELTIAGIDPLSLYEANYDRVKHFYFQDAHAVDTLGEYKTSNAEVEVLGGGGQRRIDQWFWPMGEEKGLVDFPALMKSIRQHNYSGWIIMKSNPSPHPAEGAMLNSRYVRKVLSENPRVG